jgi:hypothetical protein
MNNLAARAKQLNQLIEGRTGANAAERAGAIRVQAPPGPAQTAGIRKPTSFSKAGFASR